MRFVLLLSATAVAQKIGTLVNEQHPTIDFYECTEQACTSSPKPITLDANWCGTT